MQVHIDPKADPSLVPAIQSMFARGQAFEAECKRRGRKFLPRQVMRPIWIGAGLADGEMLRSRPENLLRLNF